MTYKEANHLIKNPFELNRKDAEIEGFQEAQVGDNTFGYRIYAIDDAGNRFSPVQPSLGRRRGVEHNVYYWHNKRIAEAYMVYLAEARPQYTYGLFRAEAIKGSHLDVELMYDEHTAHYGQVASSLLVRDEAPVQILTPEMLRAAQRDPDRELFSD